MDPTDDQFTGLLCFVSLGEDSSWSRNHGLHVHHLISAFSGPVILPSVRSPQPKSAMGTAILIRVGRILEDKHCGLTTIKSGVGNGIFRWYL